MLSGCGGGGAEAKGSVLLLRCGDSNRTACQVNPDYTSANYATVGSECSGRGGYDDLAGGAAVTVYDASGAIVGTGELAPGQVQKGVACQFDFAVKDLPKCKFYQVEVAHRGKVTEQADKIGDIGLSIGG